MQFQLQDQVKNFAAGEHAIYVISSLHGEPPGIWRCDLASGAMECVAPNVGKPFACVRDPRLATDTITNGAGEPLTYYWLSPTHSAAAEKHPLVIGILGVGQGFIWRANFDAFANCGAFFVSLDYRKRDSSQWADDAFAVYKALARRPDVDTNKIFLYSESGGSSSVFELLKKNPNLWRGAILVSPSDFPDPSQIPGSRILMDEGGDDPYVGKEGMKGPMRFQDAAALSGIPVTLIMHPGGHVSSWHVAVRERLPEAMIFLNGN
jgi:pimeloyl-ACP methyl ester carboxylesterase